MYLIIWQKIFSILKIQYVFALKKYKQIDIIYIGKIPKEKNI